MLFFTILVIHDTDLSVKMTLRAPPPAGPLIARVYFGRYNLCFVVKKVDVCIWRFI